jgi:pimeloyl-ACP methyl ester carboxylesterase
MPDLPGYGRSTPLPEAIEDRTIGMGTALGALIETLGQPTHLCGHSYGGNVALHAAMSTPDRVARLTLLEPVFFRALALAGDDQELARATQFFSSYAKRVTGGEPEAVSEMIDFWFGENAFSKLPTSVQVFLTTAAPKNGLDVLAAMSETMTREQLAVFPKPTVVAYGDASPATAPAIAKALASLLPKARLKVMAGAHHGMLDTHAQLVADLIGDPS